MQPIVNDGDTVFHVEVGSPHKRPVTVTFDSFAIMNKRSSITGVQVSLAHEMAAELLLMDDPGARAYAELIK